MSSLRKELILSHNYGFVCTRLDRAKVNHAHDYPDEEILFVTQDHDYVKRTQRATIVIGTLNECIARIQHDHGTRSNVSVDEVTAVDRALLSTITTIRDEAVKKI